MFGLTEFQLFAATLVVVGVPAVISLVLRKKRLDWELGVSQLFDDHQRK